MNSVCYSVNDILNSFRSLVDWVEGIVKDALNSLGINLDFISNYLPGMPADLSIDMSVWQANWEFPNVDWGDFGVPCLGNQDEADSESCVSL